MVAAVNQDTAVDAGEGSKESTSDHCPACTVAAVLRAHRDDLYAEWTDRRMVLNFAIVVADQACQR